MAHLVNRRGYFSLEESYRDENGRPRKRRLAYYGKRNPVLYALGIPDIDWSATLRGFPEDKGMKAAERAMAKVEERPVVEELSRLPAGLTVGPVDPAPVERAAHTPTMEAAVEPSHTPEPQDSEPQSISETESDADASGEG